MHTDKQLLKRIQNREKQALEELYDRYSLHLYNLLRLMIHNTDRIIAVIRALFEEIWRNPSHFQEDEFVSKALSNYCLQQC
ncbi:RNA polymerase sigma factor [Lentibacillus sediminis]|uniref:RNA polymerase sigma factor n=1 Tax=Lentibacillus sediminis TaxID=1940529 RepID=UPI000C1C0C34|nr:hypothetical protein [Lentibacillus sediminis]